MVVAAPHFCVGNVRGYADCPKGVGGIDILCRQHQQHAGYKLDAKVIKGGSTMFEYEDHGPSNESEGTANVKESTKDALAAKETPLWLQVQKQQQQRQNLR
jgi:hypothetical protein